MCNSPDAVLPAPGEGKRGADGHLGYLLRQAAHVHRQRVEAVLGDLDLTSAQFSALVMLEAYPAASGADLARLALLTPQTMSTIIANLLKAGLVARRAHAVHGRIQQIDLTQDGQARLTVAKARVYGLESGLLAGLSADEETIIRRWLAGVAAGA
ncbi:MarR family winged helix-turn-helix transcriptional regulator [Ancylobacter vacuolatus]|uniref:DNA-binding MarR family transcriptional regulator n=1 Tax=Ancylobacter vacuolatus TaxID=223389 RepID=A0ABU0DG42_9HYPH|nr:MarR family transcriptional regulator [Ancylobacter vacuolatus]MDQ0347392.1 DNA-binding MarR family transcriptional regulator [Ancylobacter vacuolatus]